MSFGGVNPGQMAAISEAVRQSIDQDWEAYYRNLGAQTPSNTIYYGSGRIQISCVFVSPKMEWAVPNQILTGPSMGPPKSAFPPYSGSCDSRQSSTPNEEDWVKYYKNIRPITSYVWVEHSLFGWIVVPYTWYPWAVPNSGAPSGPAIPPAFSFPAFSGSP